MKNKKICIIIIFILYLLTEKFFQLKVLILLKDPKYFYDLVALICFFIVIYYNFLKKRKIDFSYIPLVLILFYMSNLLITFLFKRNLFDSLKISRWVITHFLLYQALNYLLNDINIKIKKLNKIILGINAFLIFLNLYLLYTKNFSIIEDIGYKVRLRYGNVRFMIGGDSIIFFTIYFLINNKVSKLNYLVLMLDFFILLYISKTRVIIFSVLIIFSIYFIYTLLKKKKYIYRMLWISLPASILLATSSKAWKLFTLLFESTAYEVTNFTGNFLIRFEGIFYFLDIMEPINYIFGYGIVPTEQFAEMYNYHLGDLGIFSIFFFFGAIGLISLILTFSFYIINVAKNTHYNLFGNTTLAFLIFQLVSGITICQFLSHAGAFIIFTVIILYRRYCFEWEKYLYFYNMEKISANNNISGWPGNKNGSHI